MHQSSTIINAETNSCFDDYYKKHITLDLCTVACATSIHPITLLNKAAVLVYWRDANHNQDTNSYRGNTPGTLRQIIHSLSDPCSMCQLNKFEVWLNNPDDLTVRCVICGAREFSVLPVVTATQA